MAIEKAESSAPSWSILCWLSMISLLVSIGAVYRCQPWSQSVMNYPDYSLTDDISHPSSAWAGRCNSLSIYSATSRLKREPLCKTIDEVPKDRALVWKSTSATDAANALKSIRDGLSTLGQALPDMNQPGISYHILCSFQGNEGVAYLEAFIPTASPNVALILPRSDSNPFRSETLPSFIHLATNAKPPK